MGPMETSLRLHELEIVRERIVYRIAPDRSLSRWTVLKEGKRLKPKAKGLSKAEALEFVARLARKKAEPALVLVHKTRYIIEQQLQLRA